MAAIVRNAPEMTTVYLSGPLIRKFFRKKDYLLDSQNTWEVFRALKATLEGFEREIKRLEALGMRFAIFRNHKNVGADEFDRGGVKEVRIVPVIAGSKRAGALQTIVGAVMIVVGAVATAMGGGAFGVPMMKMGLAVAVGGVIQMLSPQAKGLSQSGAPENLPSYAFGSAKNTTASGNPVPICIGERRWGGAIISASIVAEDKA
ncbi:MULTISPECIES: tail assembly protein [Pseudomonas]|uniref:Tail assembly protein n=1 Tax=Pseudomonas guariconensis TaxID=1288410 RepID=A0AAX0VX95_9PSED|nr:MULTISPECIES: tail assembly protein [Pseudomonas]MDD2028770.1 tail assembly protein [Pseudomonas putida]PLV19325.1 tail assembly protein [Pseudomonas guariconensis]PLV24042.1 tail assembly protein [Pseudomonas guariconensis]PLV29064.1 tail assembly protein [Pseudomonas guariconensis]HDS1768658.1 tail assembly protein [Pseudomonas putida]